ncbi:hypothetical protein EEB14_33915 [Rhodococcus sp. WS4]|nr:hypothetical protein EEB14_33915 [Rhodococcus sp. WS4]
MITYRIFAFILKRLTATALTAIAATILFAGFAPQAHAAGGALKPADGIAVDRNNGMIRNCTLGFVFKGDARALTASHCGEIGQQIRTPDGSPVGLVVAHGSEDIRIIDIATDLKVYGDVEGVGTVSGYMTLDELNRTRPLLCKKGVTTGLTCGTMTGTAKDSYFTFGGGSDEGDSGAPIYAITPEGKILAAGILSGHAEEDPHTVFACIMSAAAVENRHRFWFTDPPGI